MQYCIEINNLKKTYPDFCLAIDNLLIPSGSITGLVGENGAGKTTLIDLLLNLRRYDCGSIKIFGQDSITAEQAIKRDVGFVIDGAGFSPFFDPREISSFMKYIYANWDDAVFEQFLSDLMVPLDKRIADMSKGTIAKLNISVSLAHRPKLLVLDEVTSALDPVIRRDILDFLKKYVEDTGGSILFSTHITEDLVDTASRVVFIRKGALVLNESMDSLAKTYSIVIRDEEDSSSIAENDVLASYRDGVTSSMLVRQPATIYAHSRKATISDIMLHYARDGRRIR